MIVCCDPKALPHADKSGKLKIDRPNRIRLPAGVWITVTCLFPSTIETLADPGGAIIACPENEDPIDVTAVYSSSEASGNRTLFLHAIGQWKVRNTGPTEVETKILDAHNAISALFNAGIRIASGTVGTGVPAPGTFADAGAAQDTVGVAEAEFLAAGAYKHLFFKNTSTGGQIITIRGSGTAAVSLIGWVLYPNASGDGGVISWNHPDVMPAGPFRAIASAAAGKLTRLHGT